MQSTVALHSGKAPTAGGPTRSAERKEGKVIKIPDYPPPLRCGKLSRVTSTKKKPLECFFMNPWQRLEGRHVSEVHNRRPFDQTTDISVQLTFPHNVSSAAVYVSPSHSRSSFWPVEETCEGFPFRVESTLVCGLHANKTGSCFVLLWFVFLFFSLSSKRAKQTLQ